jgi:hypothetical protein
MSSFADHTFHIDAVPDPDATFHFDAVPDPDPACPIDADADPDPSFQIKDQKVFQKGSFSIHFGLSSAN